MINQPLRLFATFVIAAAAAACSSAEQESRSAAEEAQMAADEAMAAASAASESVDDDVSASGPSFEEAAASAVAAGDVAAASAAQAAADAAAAAEASVARADEISNDGLWGSGDSRAAGVAAGQQLLGNSKYCAQLADIGRTAFSAKQDGHPMSAALGIVSSGLSHDRQRRMLAEGAVIAVYGDGSIRSPGHAYEIVHTTCMNPGA